MHNHLERLRCRLFSSFKNVNTSLNWKKIKLIFTQYKWKEKTIISKCLIHFADINLVKVFLDVRLRRKVRTILRLEDISCGKLNNNYTLFMITMNLKFPKFYPFFQDTCLSKNAVKTLLCFTKYYWFWRYFSPSQRILVSRISGGHPPPTSSEFHLIISFRYALIWRPRDVPLRTYQDFSLGTFKRRPRDNTLLSAGFL